MGNQISQIGHYIPWTVSPEETPIDEEQEEIQIVVNPSLHPKKQENPEYVVAFQMTYLTYLLESFRVLTQTCTSFSQVRILLFGNLYLPAQSSLDLGTHCISGRIFQRLRATHLGDMSGKVCLGTTIRHTIDLVKSDLTPRVLIIYLSSWVFRYPNEIGLSDHEYDLYLAIQEAYQVPLYIVFKVTSHLIPDYHRLEREILQIHPSQKLNMDCSHTYDNHTSRASEEYISWWYSQFENKLQGNHLVRPRLINPNLLNVETSYCCKCQQVSAVKSKSCFHMFCHTCLPDISNDCPICQEKAEKAENGRQLFQQGNTNLNYSLSKNICHSLSD